MSWSDKLTDPLPQNHPEGKVRNINWGSLLIGAVAGYIIAAYGPKFLNR